MPPAPPASVVAKVQSLQLRPIVSTDLCFNLPGVIAHRNMSLARLGKAVTEYDLNSKIYEPLAKDRMDNAGNVKELTFDSAKLKALLAPQSLYVVRNVGLATELDRAINRRNTLFWQRYQHITQIIAAWDLYVAPKIASTKVLPSVFESRYKEVLKAYQDQKIDGTVTMPITVTQHTGKLYAETKIRPIGMKQDEQVVEVQDAAGNLQNKHITHPFSTVPVDKNRAELPDEYPSSKITSYYSEPGKDRPTLTYGNLIGTTTPSAPPPTSGDPAVSSLYSQLTTNTNEEFKHPSKDLEIAYRRAQNSAYDDAFVSELQSYQRAKLEILLKAELERIDLEVRQLQLNYVHTFLVPPSSGVVTAIYKDNGETVEPGQPIIRIEDASDDILLVGFIQCKQTLSVGEQVRIHTDDSFKNGNAWDNTGHFVSVRGHDANNDRWEVVVETKNNQAVLLPINYSFDKYHTTLSIP